MATPFVSIVVTAYQKEKYLAESIQSAINQSFSNYEIIVVNDASTDGTLGIINNIRQNNPTIDIKIINHKKNLGVVKSRNAAIRLAKAEWIAILDGDDVWAEHKLEKQVDFIKSNPDIMLVGGAFKIISESGAEIGQEAFPTTNDDIQEGMSISNHFGHSSCIFNRKLALKVGLYPNSRPVEDYEFLSNLCAKTKVANLPMVLYKYRQDTGGITNQEKDLQDNMAKVVSEKNWKRLHPRITNSKIIKDRIFYYESLTNDSLINAAITNKFLQNQIIKSLKFIKHGSVFKGLKQIIYTWLSSNMAKELIKNDFKNRLLRL